MFRENDRITAAICALLLLLAAGSALADTNAESFRFYIDSVKAGPGQDIPVRFNIQNDQPLNAVNLPITYDSDLLTLRAIDFAGSRGDHIDGRFITPDTIQNIDGHFNVGLVKLFSDPIPAGDGLIFTAIFTVADTIAGRINLAIDTLAYVPAGPLLFVLADSLSTSILPDFSAGHVYVDAANKAPKFTAVADQFVLEGDSLNLNLQVSDPNADNIRIVCTESPAGVKFTDRGDGTAALNWVPPYVGPGSADNAPFVFGFWTTDGDLSDRIEVVVNVLNRNRPPEVVVTAETQILAGDSLVIQFGATEPDFEAISWEYINLPEQIVFDKNVSGHAIWPSSVVDSGDFEFGFVAVDPHGLADTGYANVKVLPVDLYTLHFDTVSAFPNAFIDVNVRLDNKLPVSSFKLLINYDPLALTLLDIVPTGTRSSGFELFEYNNNDEGVPGNIRISGTADMGGGAEAIPAGNGPVAKIQFHIVNNVTLGGSAPPLRYVFEDSLDNTVTDSIGQRVGQSDMSYQNSYVNILEVGLIKIGDINLNGIPYEVGDAIYFGNYFMDPVHYPFNVVQYANSDVNHDGIVATIADLIALINVIIDGSPSAKVETGKDLSAKIYVDQQEDITLLTYDANFEVGGLFMEYRSTESRSARVESAFKGVELLTAQEGDAARILLFSMDGVRMPQGEHQFVELVGIDGFQSDNVQLASADGQLVRAEIVQKNAGLPTEFALEQNYPNPFNPETNIRFDLPADGRVELTVFNVLGRKVKSLIDDHLPAGSHIVTWDGRDDSDQPVASGVYLYRLVASGKSDSRKMMLLK